MEDTIRRKLRVTTQESIGKTAKGSDIFSVTAVDEDGAPCELELRSFQELPLGEIHEYTLKHYFNPKYGESWTMYSPDEAKPRLTDRVTAIEERFAKVGQAFSELTQRVERAEKQIAQLVDRLDEDGVADGEDAQ